MSATLSPAPRSAVQSAPLHHRLSDALEQLGYEPGAPEHITAATLRIDATTCKRRRCRCGHRGLDFVPWHRGPSYRATATCPACLAAEEL
jgi:hypothetical protein